MNFVAGPESEPFVELELGFDDLFFVVLSFLFLSVLDSELFSDILSPVSIVSEVELWLILGTGLLQFVAGSVVDTAWLLTTPLSFRGVEVVSG